MTDALTVLTLPLPPSANRMWRVARNRVMPSKDYAEWKAAGAFSVTQQLGGAPALSWFTARLILPPTRRDPDNSIKPCLDCLQAGGAIRDDAMLRKLVLAVDDERGAAETVLILLEPAPPPAAVLERRRGWEAAVSLLDDYRDRLTPAEYARCLGVQKEDPDTLRPERAAAMLRLYARRVEARV